MNKGIFIKDIQDGQNIDGVFLVKDMNRAETRAGKPYLMLTVMDRTGEMAARVWEDADRYADICPAGSIIRLFGQAQAYKNVLQLKINDLQPVEEPFDPALFLPATAGDIESMGREITRLAEGCKDPHIRSLLLSFFQSASFFEAFKKAPAAKFMHHAYIGGLLEHSLGVARLADSVCALYPVLDRDLLMAGAILHDVGKVAEFSFEVFPFDYSDRGRLVGHMVLGIEMIQNRISTLPDFPEEIATQLNHLILSHHGRHEFGSPVLPMTMEAFVLNFLDELDSKINYINRLGGQASEESYQWSDYQRNLERFLFVRGAAEQTMAIEGEKPAAQTGGTTGSAPPLNVDPRQTSFWK